ncbi:hypothetical protein tpqmel_0311 [Candidatus Gastranaerophilus sp. (ex Termes propinquus)]|nr:hypothetical protein tpqmel_0311 [Candidatus Gastranaerophilus sp. (ex Termes propinquus)]
MKIANVASGEYRSNLNQKSYVSSPKEAIQPQGVAFRGTFTDQELYDDATAVMNKAFAVLGKTQRAVCIHNKYPNLSIADPRMDNFYKTEKHLGTTHTQLGTIGLQKPTDAFDKPATPYDASSHNLFDFGLLVPKEIYTQPENGALVKPETLKTIDDNHPAKKNPRIYDTVDANYESWTDRNVLAEMFDTLKQDASDKKTNAAREQMRKDFDGWVKENAKECERYAIADALMGIHEFYFTDEQKEKGGAHVSDYAPNWKYSPVSRGDLGEPYTEEYMAKLQGDMSKILKKQQGTKATDSTREILGDVIYGDVQVMLKAEKDGKGNALTKALAKFVDNDGDKDLANKILTGKPSDEGYPPVGMLGIFDAMLFEPSDDPDLQAVKDARKEYITQVKSYDVEKFYFGQFLAGKALDLAGEMHRKHGLATIVDVGCNFSNLEAQTYPEHFVEDYVTGCINDCNQFIPWGGRVLDGSKLFTGKNDSAYVNGKHDPERLGPAGKFLYEKFKNSAQAAVKIGGPESGIRVDHLDLYFDSSVQNTKTGKDVRYSDLYKDYNVGNGRIMGEIVIPAIKAGGVKLENVILEDQSSDPNWHDKQKALAVWSDEYGMKSIRSLKTRYQGDPNRFVNDLSAEGKKHAQVCITTHDCEAADKLVASQSNGLNPGRAREMYGDVATWLESLTYGAKLDPSDKNGKTIPSVATSVFNRILLQEGEHMNHAPTYNCVGDSGKGDANGGYRNFGIKMPKEVIINYDSALLQKAVPDGRAANTADAVARALKSQGKDSGRNKKLYESVLDIARVHGAKQKDVIIHSHNHIHSSDVFDV